MEFSQLEKKYKNFYAPNFMILVKGKDLLKESVEVFGVTVNHQLNGTDTFSFKVNNPLDSSGKEFLFLKKGGLFEVGNSVEIKIGYGDRTDLPTLLDGVITSVGVSFPANGISQLDIQGHDRSHLMMKGQRSDNYGSSDEPIKYSDIVKKLVGTYSLSSSNVVDSKEKHQQVKQDRMSDFHFIVNKLANEMSFEAFVQVKDFFFRPRANDEQAVVTTLKWGVSLVSFSPTINTAPQVSEVEVRGWDPAKQEAIIGRAKKGDEQGRDGGRSSGADVVGETQGNRVLHVWKPVKSQKEADDLAKAILNNAAEKYVTGNGQSIGIPDILPGKNIELTGMGKMFNKKYYIETSSHTVDSSGYKTSFTVKETTI